MVEKVVQKEEEEKAEEGNLLFKLPKHIKQMGRGGNCPEIYIEDYAEGYLRRLAGSDYTECRVAVLVGEFVKSEGKRFVFIRGAIEAEDVMEENVPKFTSEAWAGVYEKIKRYFPRYEAVGWFLGGPEFLTEINDTIRQTHLDWFGGRDRVLYKVDPVEKEASFYLYDKGELKQWPGYCIYYERNEEMQDYLVSGNPVSVDEGYREPILAELGRRVGRKGEASEQSLGELAVSAEGTDGMPGMPGKEPKKKQKNEKGGNHYGAAVAVAALLLAVGAFAVYRSDYLAGMKSLQTTPGLTPTVAGYVAGDDIGELLQTGAKVENTPVPTPSVGITPSGGDLSQGFVPIDEEPYVPGSPTKSAEKPDKKPTESIQPTKSAEKTTPSATPQGGDNGVIINDAMELYIVQAGDTLAGICRRFYGDVLRMEEIKGINQIPDENRIYAGQELYLP